MAKKYFLVHFSGHGKPELQGERDQTAFRNLAPLLTFGDVSRFAFYAGLGKKKSQEVARKVKGIVDGYNGGSSDGITFIIHGYSAGGITALHFASLVPDSQIVYIALSDAAFYRGDTDYLMNTPGSQGYYLNENYYQTYENSASVDEIHDRITATGWKNRLVLLGGKWPFKNNYHDRAVAEADAESFATMQDIIKKDL